MPVKLDIQNWNRKAHFEFFNSFADPYFAVVNKFEVSVPYKISKEKNLSFFGLYLHACMKAVNAVENFKYRIYPNEILVHEVIHASATIARHDHTFGCTFIEYTDDVFEFLKNLSKEKQRVLSSTDFFPPTNSLDCIYCSALPWIPFTGHKEPFCGFKESVPKLAFSGLVLENDKVFMNVSISVNHALMDGYHVGQFAGKFQENLSNFVIKSSDGQKQRSFA